MTALCSGGASGPKAGLGDQITLTTSAVEAILEAIPARWALPFAAILGLVTEHLTTFCTTDPPGYPTFTAQDFVDLINPLDFAAHLAASRKFRDLVDTYLWYQSCVCTSVSTPSAPTAPTEPTGMPTINPGGVGTQFPTGDPCQTLHVEGTGASIINDPDYNYPKLNGATLVTMVLSTTGANPTAGDYGFGLRFWTAAHVFISQGVAFSLTTTGPVSIVTAVVPANADNWSIETNTTGGYNGTQTWSADIAFYCGTTPGGGGVVPQACQTDPGIQLLLGQILALVTLIQRNGVPFAYVPGAVHSALSGNGTLTIPSCIGIQIDLTTIPTYVGDELGSPTEFFEAGWFSWGTTDGFLAREFISHDPQLSFPAKAEQYTRIGYSLTPGVVATITELYAET